jgi:hypothetical protein
LCDLLTILMGSSLSKKKPGQHVGPVGNDTFGVTSEQLQELLTLSKQPLIDKVEEEYGGIDGLCDKLDTSMEGLPAVSDEEFRRRQEASSPFVLFHLPA